MRRTRSLAALLTIGLILGAFVSTHAAEMVDNPQYTSWAKCKPGTKMTMKQDMDMGAMKMTNTMVQTLQEVTPEKAVIEFVITIDMGGQKQETKKSSDIPAKVEKGHENMPQDMTGTTKDVGTEKIEIAGKTYECKVSEFTGETAQSKATGKTWRTPEIPGGVAKIDMKMQAPQDATIKMIVTSIELK